MLCLRDPAWHPMSLASLEAFLARVQTDPGLRELLATAPDAASVAAIARTAGFPVSERDLWQATAAVPEDQAPAEVFQTVEPPGLPAEERKAPPLPDPWFPEEPLTRFVHQAQGDAELREALATAPDAAAVASIAQAAGYPISAVDLWLASGTTPDELAASLRPPDAEPWASDGADEAGTIRVGAEEGSEADVSGGGAEEGSEADVMGSGAGGVSEGGASWREREAPASRPGAGEGGVDRQGTAGVLVGDDLEEAGDLAEPPREKRALDVEPSFGEESPLADDVPPAVAPPLADVDSSTGVLSATVARPAAEDPALAPTDFFVDSGAFPAEARDARESPETEATSRALLAEAIQRFLQEAAADARLRQALASAPDASAVAAIAREAGHPLTELTLWLASDASFEEAHSQPPAPTLEADPLTLFLRAVEVDPDLQIALASAPDAATVAAIARIAGFPLTAADLWAASDAAPQELELERLVEEMLMEPVVILEC